MTPTTTRARKPAAAKLPAELQPKAAEPPPPPAPVVEQTFAMIAVADIRPNPDNPRSDLGDLDELADSIRAIGLLEPLLVEPIDVAGEIRSGESGPGLYLLLAGHRRLAAAGLAAVPQVPCMIRATTSTPAERLEMALVENLQRETLAPMDEARGYGSLVELGLSQRAIADRVGCSQSHVSKRLDLLDLPSHVQARIVKGTMPLQAAAALVKLKDHPDKLKKAAGEDPSAIPQAVERAEKVIAWEAKRAELVDVAKGKGWPVVDEPGWSAKRSFATLAHWNGPPDLDIDAKKHEAEPCHGVMIPGDPPQWYAIGVPSATSVCTEPARHGSKGASALKAKPAPKPRRDPVRARELQEQRDRKAAAAARAGVLAEALANHRNTQPPSPAPLALTLTHLVRTAGWETAKVACEMLDLEVEKDLRPPEALRRFAAGNDHALHRAGLALAFARVETGLRFAYGGFSGDEVADHFAYLAELGYEPTPWERTKLAEAANANDAHD